MGGDSISKCVSRSPSAVDAGLRLSSVQPPGCDLPLHRRQKWPRNPQENCGGCHLSRRGRRSSARRCELCICRCEAGQLITPLLPTFLSLVEWDPLRRLRAFCICRPRFITPYWPRAKGACGQKLFIRKSCGRSIQAIMYVPHPNQVNPHLDSMLADI